MKDQTFSLPTDGLEYKLSRFNAKERFAWRQKGGYEGERRGRARSRDRSTIRVSEHTELAFHCVGIATDGDVSVMVTPHSPMLDLKNRTLVP